MDNIEFENENIINANQRFMFPLSFSGICPNNKYIRDVHVSISLSSAILTQNGQSRFTVRVLSIRCCALDIIEESRDE